MISIEYQRMPLPTVWLTTLHCRRYLATHRRLFKKWSNVFPQMEAAAKQFVNEPTSTHRDAFFAAYEPFLAVSRNNNTTFLELCMDEYQKRL
jgi:hypothetical protein